MTTVLDFRIICIEVVVKTMQFLRRQKYIKDRTRQIFRSMRIISKKCHIVKEEKFSRISKVSEGINASGRSTGKNYKVDCI